MRAGPREAGAHSVLTVYAHAKELNVKRGDRIKRGDVVARSGRTGYASTPQLYFEVRKDSAAVDPLHFLPGTMSQTSRKMVRSLRPRRKDPAMARVQ